MAQTTPTRTQTTNALINSRKSQKTTRSQFDFITKEEPHIQRKQKDKKRSTSQQKKKDSTFTLDPEPNHQKEAIFPQMNHQNQQKEAILRREVPQTHIPGERTTKERFLLHKRSEERGNTESETLKSRDFSR